MSLTKYVQMSYRLGRSKFISHVLPPICRTLGRSRSSFLHDVSKAHQSAEVSPSLQTLHCHRSRPYQKCSVTLTGPLIPKHYQTSKTETVFNQIRGFHITPRRNIPPVFWIFIKPVAKLGAILSGRSARKWWQSLSTKKRQHFWVKVRERWYMIPLIAVGLSGLGLLYYRSHVEETPITDRRRFIAVTHEQFMKIATAEAESHLENFKDQMLPSDHPYYQRVVRVGNRLVKANPDISKLMKSVTWKCYVIDDPTTINAFVLPTGHIFVFSGIIDFAQNDDQLAIIIAHEMAHALLNHGIEHVSYAQLLDFFIIVTMAAIWCIVPSDGISLVSQWFYEKFISLMLHMPYSRMLEKEADKVGLQLAAKACYDVREGSVFWARMGLNDSITASDESVPEWLSTHPSYEKRVELFDFLIPKATEIREDANCVALPKNDPREAIKVLSLMVDEHLAAKRTGQNLSKVKMLTPVPVSTSS
ncbi:metalloendopeptidase OMA1, mitochondrial-like [Babylonia areolata]|uniref:metalloendopeptidase OMA1, mitochondrial-like n=1 Tax=Babylonia areolata TaxID=304850 RepID=UPI003FD0CF36